MSVGIRRGTSEVNVEMCASESSLRRAKPALTRASHTVNFLTLPPCQPRVRLWVESPPLHQNSRNTPKRLEKSLLHRRSSMPIGWDRSASESVLRAHCPC